MLLHYCTPVLRLGDDFPRASNLHGFCGAGRETGSGQMNGFR